MVEPLLATRRRPWKELKNKVIETYQYDHTSTIKRSCSTAYHCCRFTRAVFQSKQNVPLGERVETAEIATHLEYKNVAMTSLAQVDSIPPISPISSAAYYYYIINITSHHYARAAVGSIALSVALARLSIVIVGLLACQ